MFGRMAALLLAWAIAPAAAETGWTAIATRDETVTVEKQEVALSLAPSFRLVATKLELRLDIGLADLQRKIPAVLDHWAERKSDSCGLSWSFRKMEPAAYAQGRLQVAGELRLTQRACLAGVKTRLWRETAQFRLAVVPVVAGNRIRLAAELEHFDLGKSVLKEAGIDKELEAAAEAAVRSVVYEEVSVGFPKKVRELDPKLLSAELQDGGHGSATLRAEAEANVSLSDIPGLMELLTSRRPTQEE